MKKAGCEDVLIAQMAAADREEFQFSKDLLNAHVAGCANCQCELKQMQDLDQLLAHHTLAEAGVDLWPMIENRIAQRASVDVN